MNEKWIYSRYIIDAKKDVDSIMYIGENIHELSHLNIYNLVQKKRQSFHISLCVFMDKILIGKKKETKAEDTVVDEIYKERNKKSAHIDDDFTLKDYTQFQEIIDELKTRITHIFDKFRSFLPDVLTLEFVPFDSVLFRLVNGITFDEEEKILSRKHPLIDKMKASPNSKMIKTVNNVDDLKKIKESEKGDYGVIFSDGLTTFEGLQRRQDSCILSNLFYDTNMWCSFNEDAIKTMKALEECGFIDKFGAIRKNAFSNKKIFEKAMKILDES